MLSPNPPKRKDGRQREKAWSKGPFSFCQEVKTPPYFVWSVHAKWHEHQLGDATAPAKGAKRKCLCEFCTRDPMQNPEGYTYLRGASSTLHQPLIWCQIGFARIHGPHRKARETPSIIIVILDSHVFTGHICSVR